MTTLIFEIVAGHDPGGYETSSKHSETSVLLLTRSGHLGVLNEASLRKLSGSQPSSLVI